uniref:Uncharacterized protein LOC104240746 n=1 Tax=Nicotiana sylvestris TaxID=4096 RepID=A0A1U7XSL8_NICSY|nr:PREDICTED: uncharacterized protein LOC104240746 [Nicotiana sylvestris]
MNSFKFYLPILVLLQILTTSLATIYQVEVGSQMAFPLSIQCTAQGHNISKSSVGTGLVFTFPIDTNAANPTASCQLSSGTLHGNFVLFDPSIDQNRCANASCKWSIDGDGIYLFTNDEMTLIFKWP